MDEKIRYYAVVDNRNNYFNGSNTYEEALEELKAYREGEIYGNGDFLFDPSDVLLVAVLDV